jgi:hypothetical protein
MKKQSNKLHRHHRRPRSIGGTNKPTNISFVNRDEHAAWHRLFFNYEAEKIADLINGKWLDPKYRLVCVRREEE